MWLTFFTLLHKKQPNSKEKLTSLTLISNLSIGVHTPFNKGRLNESTFASLHNCGHHFPNT